MKKGVLDPREREYQVGDVDLISIHDIEGTGTEGLVKAKVIGFESGGAMQPIFEVVSEGFFFGKTFHWWHISFT